MLPTVNGHAQSVHAPLLANAELKVTVDFPFVNPEVLSRLIARNGHDGKLGDVVFHARVAVVGGRSASLLLSFELAQTTRPAIPSVPRRSNKALLCFIR
jgi:hypothetical protein